MDRARRNEAAIIAAIHRAKQVNIARELGVSEATITNWVNDYVPKVARLMACGGVKAVSIDLRCYSPQTIHAMFTLAQERLNQIKAPVEELAWDE